MAWLPQSPVSAGAAPSTLIAAGTTVMAKATDTSISLEAARRVPGAVAPAERLRRWVQRNWYPLATISPTVVILFLLTIFPLIYAVYISFQNFELPRPHLATFIGLGNFAEVLADGRFWVALYQTAILMVGAITVQFVLGLALATFFFDDFRGRSAKSIYLPLILIPMMIAPVLVGYMWRLIFQVEFGPLNYLLLNVFGRGPYEWTSSTSLALASVILVDIWQWTPFVTVVLLAGMASLSLELLEAAQIDGANAWQRLVHVILPLIRNVIAIVLLIRFLDAFREFDKIFVLTQGGPGTATEVASYYAYLSGFKFFRVGYASAMAILLLFVTVILCTTIARLLQRTQEAE
jgi:multiple sugar transport system permease protein